MPRTTNNKAPVYSYYDKELEMEFRHPREEYILTGRAIDTISPHWKGHFTHDQLRRLCKKEGWVNLRTAIARWEAYELARQAGAAQAKKKVQDLGRIDKTLGRIDSVLEKYSLVKQLSSLTEKEAIAAMIDLIKARRLLSGESTETIAFQDMQIIIQHVMKVIYDYVPEDRHGELTDRIRGLLPEPSMN